MKKNNFYFKLILFTIMISACGGDDLAINVEESKTITKSAMVLEQGFNFKDKAIPTAIGKPCPKAPVDASIPGTFSFSGCPPRMESNFKKLSNSFILKNFLSARMEYNAKQPCPLLSIILSALSFFKKSNM